MRKKTTRKKVQKKKDTNPPKHFVGALIGAGVSVAGSIVAAKKEEKANLEIAQDRQASTYASQMSADKLELEDYPEEGLGTVDYYQAKGGKLATPMSYKTRGGDLEPVSSDMEEVVGNKHNESAIDNTSGVKLNNGKSDIAEVEDEEMIKDGRMVFSAQTKVDGNKTYADVAKKLSTEKGKLEEGLMTKDKISMDTGRRKIKAIDKAENALFIKQEAEKGNDVQGDLPKGDKGIDLYKDNLVAGFDSWKDAQSGTSKVSNTFANSGIGKGATAAIPLIDNVANMILTSKTPKLPKPTLVRQKNLETEVNVNPQLAAVSDAVDSSNRFVTNNSSSSAVARNAVAKTRLAGAKQTGQILAGKENQERTLRNQNVQQRQQVEAVNAQKLDTAALAETGRQDAIQQRTSANLANMAGDLVDNRNFKAAEDYNAERLDVAREIGDVNGTSLRADLKNPTEQNKLRTDKAYAQQQLERYKNSPKELAELKAFLGI